MLSFFFFFSSRRRHTRLQGDWSSDVCSSDLGLERLDRGGAGGRGGLPGRPRRGLQRSRAGARATPAGALRRRASCSPRSEERRVGKRVDLGGGRIIKKKKKEEERSKEIRVRI